MLLTQEEREKQTPKEKVGVVEVLPTPTLSHKVTWYTYFVHSCICLPFKINLVPSISNPVMNLT